MFTSGTFFGIAQNFIFNVLFENYCGPNLSGVVLYDDGDISFKESILINFFQ